MFTTSEHRKLSQTNVTMIESLFWKFAVLTMLQFWEQAQILKKNNKIAVISVFSETMRFQT